MSQKTKYIAAIDLECTCSDDESVSREEMEIIEFGCSILDEKYNIVKEISYFVRPTLNPVLTEFCKELTTITQEQVDIAETWDVVYEKIVSELKEYSDIKWTSWGFFDKNQIRKDCTRLSMDNFFDDIPYFNAKDLDSDFRGTKKGRGLTKACNDYGIKFEGTLHRACDDARMVARIVKHILEKSE